MARRHGRNTRVYMNLTSGGTAEPIAFVKSYSFSAATDKADVTAYGDRNKKSVVGLPGDTGTVAGFSLELRSLAAIHGGLDPASALNLVGEMAFGFGTAMCSTFVGVLAYMLLSVAEHILSHQPAVPHPMLVPSIWMNNPPNEP